MVPSLLTSQVVVARARKLAEEYWMSRSIRARRGIGAVESAGAGDAIGPGILVDVKGDGIGERDDGLFLAEVVGLRRSLHLLQLGLFLRVSGERTFVGLIGAGP